ncbi:gag/pol protein [Cucumis melo var. makuwa]|uniref:Gag/pol protein n=1 Tax=Cucumis melo var. makuwa TaxID=1194695 RepID=A0A5A7SPT6_CUCMM|nr:gag/pol protein [Cucumis melo var. makuwa]TYK07502.1 gag/pol protein [Cucumis melo var. makuwa]
MVGRAHGTKKKGDRRRAAAGCLYVGNVRLTTYGAETEVECVAEADTTMYEGAILKFGCREDSTATVNRRRRLQARFRREARLDGKRRRGEGDGGVRTRRIFESRIENEVEDPENDEKDDEERDKDVDYASSSMPSSSKNALISTRCKSAPYRSSFNDNRYLNFSITSDRTAEEEEKIESSSDSTLNPKEQTPFIECLHGSVSRSHHLIPIMCLLVCPGATFPLKGCIIGFETSRTPYMDRNVLKPLPQMLTKMFGKHIFASMSDVLAKKHESLATTKKIMDSLREMFGRPSWSFRHEASNYIYTKQMNEVTSVIEHVLGMMRHFNILEVSDGPINENLTTCKRKAVEANVATTKKEFMGGSSSKTKVGPSQMKKMRKGKTSKNSKGKKVDKDKCYDFNEDGH